MQPDLEPVALAVAPNGGRRTHADHPALPITVAELARDAAACREAGACMIHAHVRDRDGRHLLDAEAYRGAITAIRSAVGESLVIQITSESLGIYSPDEQMEVVRQVRPEAVSLALRELVPGEEHEPAFADFLIWLNDARIIPQIILYSPQDVVRLADMIKRGLVPFSSVPALFVLGRYTAGQLSRPDDVIAFLGPDLPRFDHWMLCAFGPRETACVTAGALLGGHMRVGFENNLYLPCGRRAADNAALVAAAASAIGACGLMLAEADGLRQAWSASRS